MAVPLYILIAQQPSWQRHMDQVRGWRRKRDQSTQHAKYSQMNFVEYLGFDGQHQAEVRDHFCCPPATPVRTEPGKPTGKPTRKPREPRPRKVQLVTVVPLHGREAALKRDLRIQNAQYMDLVDAVDSQTMLLSHTEQMIDMNKRLTTDPLIRRPMKTRLRRHHKDLEDIRLRTQHSIRVQTNYMMAF